MQILPSQINKQWQKTVAFAQISRIKNLVLLIGELWFANEMNKAID
jgi:hypothetical protein